MSGIRVGMGKRAYCEHGSNNINSSAEIDFKPEGTKRRMTVPVTGASSILFDHSSRALPLPNITVKTNQEK